MSLNSCPCQCHTGTGVSFQRCSLCWSQHGWSEPDVTVTSNINEIKLDQIIQLLKDILEELKKKK